LASLRLLFFDVSVFKLLAGDVFIHQVIGVFTRIRSGATPAADYGGAYRLDLLRGDNKGVEGHKCRCV
jgi:hypothetical protein